MIAGLLIPLNLVFLKIGKQNIYKSLGTVLIMMLINLVVTMLYIFGLIEEVTSTWKFISGIIIGIIGNLTAKIWYVYEE